MPDHDPDDAPAQAPSRVGPPTIWDPNGYQRLITQAITPDAGMLSSKVGFVVMPALQALSANRQAAGLLSEWRWTAMRDARNQGATWTQIGEALGMSKQGAYDYYRKASEAQELGTTDNQDSANEPEANDRTDL